MPAVKKSGAGSDLVKSNIDKELISYDINIPYQELQEAKATKYSEYWPIWEKVWYKTLPLFDFEDPALRVHDKFKPNLLTPDVNIQDVQSHMCSYVHGMQLDKLTSVQKDELALLISERKVLVFPDQDLIDKGPDAQQEFMRYFGKLNYQPVSGTVRGYPAFHIIYRDRNREEIARFFKEKATSCLWHQDVSYEAQPPGYVMLGLLQGPDVGGDTIFAATDEAYKRLSPTFGTLLDGLEAVHSSAKMISHARAIGGVVRKDPVETVHPLVRVHPVTGKKCLFVNREFITHIHGMKREESELLLSFLLQHVIAGHDFQARVRWQPRTVVLFDNRSVIHSAAVDYVEEGGNSSPRHMFRLCAMTEVPKPVLLAAQSPTIEDGG